MRPTVVQPKLQRTRLRIIVVILSLICLTSAKHTQAGFLEGLADFGKNLLSTAATNYNTMYGNQLEQLLTALRQPSTEPLPSGMPGGALNAPFNPYPSNTGFPQDQGGMQEYSDEEQAYQGSPGSPEQQYGYEDTTEYAQQSAQDYYDKNQQESQYSNDQYGENQDQGNPYDNSSGSAYANNPETGYATQEYSNQGTPESYPSYSDQGNGNDFGQDPNQPQILNEPIKLDVALARKAIVNGAETMIPIQDGEILRDGRGNAQAGDKFRIMFRANTECHIYVIAIDGSAWAQGIFPTMNSPFANPVQKNHQYVIPEGKNWLSLDQFRGIETIFFVASHEKRDDIETILSQIAGQERHPKATPDQVSEPPIVPAGYYGQSTSTSPFTMTTNAGQGFLPTTFMTEKAGQALRVTRWFRHQ